MSRLDCDWFRQPWLWEITPEHLAEHKPGATVVSYSDPSDRGLILEREGDFITVRGLYYDFNTHASFFRIDGGES